MATQKHTSPPRGFTVAFLDNVKPAASRYELRDTACPGLRVRVEPTGRVSFVWYYAHQGKTRVLTLGAYGEGEGYLSLKDARKALEKAKGRHREGKRPGPDPDAPSTVAHLAEQFYADIIRDKRKRPEEARRILDVDIIPNLGARKLETLGAPDIRSVVRKVIKRGAETHAGKVLGLMKLMFSYAESNGIVERSPAYSLKAQYLGVVNNIRSRALDVDEEGNAQVRLTEIPALWKALDAAPRLSAQIRCAIKLLLLTGVRSGELRLARWEHVDFDNALWRIPAINTKTGTAWSVPLSDMALALLRELETESEGGDWVLQSVPWSVEHNAPITDKALARALKRLFELKDGKGKPLLAIEPFVPHDLRRTLRTHLSRLGVAPHIAEKCLNHSLGRIERTYDRHTYQDEHREALQRWADAIDLAIHPRENVVELGRSAP